MWQCCQNIKIFIKLEYVRVKREEKMGILDFLRGNSKENDGHNGPKPPIVNPNPVIIMDNADWNQILCPYCFESFSHDQVHFRSVTVKSALSDEQLEELYGDDDDLLEEKREENEIARKFEEQKADPELENFWGRFGIMLDQREEKDNWKNPVIRPKMDDQMLYHQNKADGLIYTEKFLSRVKDYYAGNSTQRLCPHCHNRLAPSYGENKVIFISIVGITGSGKTVYLNQLLQSIKKTLSNAGVIVNSTFNMKVKEPILKGQILPAGTQEGTMYDPIIMNITAERGGEKEDYTLVFYDIAGENCISDEMLFAYGPYLKQSQAIIMLMDPEQFTGLATETVTSDVSLVTDALIQFFKASGKGERPIMAATLSKSDRIKEKIVNNIVSGINEESIVFKNITRKTDKKGFYRQSYNQMVGAMQFLMKKLEPDGAIQSQLRNNFKKTAFFAVSALGVPPQAKFNIGSEEEPLYIDLDPNFGAEEAIKNLKIRGITPPLYKGRRQVFLGYHPEDGSEVILSFDEIRESDSMIEYWMEQHPLPCRIEEPLTWILYELGVIQGVDA